MKSTLGEFWNDKNVTSLWISGHAIAGGKTYTQNLEDEGEDYCDLHELIDNGLSIEPAWDLSGQVVEDGSWVWDGKADFRDVQGNSYFRMQVFTEGDDPTVCGKQVQEDKSGVGHCWVNVSRDDLPKDVAEYIECEIIDGKLEKGHVNINRINYRW